MRGDAVRSAGAAALALSILAVVGVAGCGETPEAAATPPRLDIDPPAAPGAFAPRLRAGGGELLATWWEPLDPARREAGHRLLFSRYSESWSQPAIVVEGDDLFANWADFPNVIREPGGGLLVAWPGKTAEETYAYSIFLARSEDDGATWHELGKLNDDVTDTEHGFVSLVPEGEVVRAFWLDGRQMAEGGPMSVRTAVVSSVVGPSELLDERVCECCPTDAVATTAGALVAYRDRAEDEVREIGAVWRRSEGWSEPLAVTSDAWRIPGCPVNGPAVDHRDGSIALAWYTGAEGAAHVGARFLSGEGADSEPVVIDGERPLGRVGLVLDSNGDAIVSWLAVVGKEAELRLRRVSAAGELGAPLAIARTSAARASGMPQLVHADGRLYVGWVEIVDGAPSRVRVRSLATEIVPLGESDTTG